MIAREDEIIKAYEDEIKNINQKSLVKDLHYSPTVINQSEKKQNLIEYELEFKSEIEDIERLLRCDIIVRDNDGNEYWSANPDKNRIFFNELGVSDIVRNIIILVNKNKALSNYSPEEINDRVKQIKHELRVLIYNNYELYGMDNDYKMNNYSMIVLTIGSIIEDVYRRAMNGETHRGLSEQRLVTQTEPLSNNNQGLNIQMPTKKKWYNPFT